MNINFTDKIERWRVFEIDIENDVRVKNPFTDVVLRAEISSPSGKITHVNGFYSGNKTWKIRFMPDLIGSYNFRLSSNLEEINGYEGKFESIINNQTNHGPVKTKGTHFFYADETPANICGTTLYAWWYRPEEICKQTLTELKKYGFNKVRMLVFPKYLAGFKEFDLIHQPEYLPFEKKGEKFDFLRPVNEYFDLLEKRIKELDEIGVEADVILFHNYDFGMWRIDEQLSDDYAISYLNYMIARFSAFKNVWWSLANEYDISKRPDGTGCIYKVDRRDWNRIGNYLLENDPHQRLRSVHNIGPIFPNENWLTHVSVQYQNTYSLLLDLKNTYKKPVINDEYQYEGNLIDDWGNVSGIEETIRHWLATMAGCYATHGECFKINGNRNDIFWTYGGKITGESASRISFMKKLLNDIPFTKMEPDFTLSDGRGSYYLKDKTDCFLSLYLPEAQKRARTINFGITDGTERTYKITVYDLWNECVLREFEYTHGELTNPDEESIKTNPLTIREDGLIGVIAKRILK